MKITIEEIMTFCQSREVDLVLRSADAPHQLCLHGEFDGYGDLFSILVGGVEYIDVAGGFPVGGIQEMSFSDAQFIAPKWANLAGEYSGRCLVIWNANAAMLRASPDKHRYLVVANDIEIESGHDWMPVSGGRG